MAVLASNYPTSLDTTSTLGEVSNRAKTTLSVALANTGETQISLSDASSFPTTGTVTIDNEIFYYSNKSGNVLTIESRAAQGTVAAAHSNGATVYLRFTKGHWEVIRSSVISLETKLGTSSSTPTSNTWLKGTGTGTSAWSTITKSDVGLSAVENTALSTWAGTSNITTVGTVGTGTWQAGIIASTYGGTGINNAGRTLTINTNSGTLTFTNPTTTLTIANTGSISGTNTGDQTITLTSDVTGSGTGSFATTIANSAVTLAKMADVATSTVFYRKTAGTGAPEVQTLATLKTDLGLTGTNSGDQTITLTGDVTGSGTGSFAASIGANKVTLGMLATLAANSVIGNSTGSTATPTAVSMVTTASASSVLLRDSNANAVSNNFLPSYATTATAGGTTTLTVSSAYYQFFTGTLTQTLQLPVASTLANGQSWVVENNSTGAVTVQTSGLNTLLILAAGTRALITCINTAGGTGTASWDFIYYGDVVASGKKLNVSNSLTLAGTDGTTMTFPSTSATIARTDAANTFTGTQTFNTPIAASSVATMTNTVGGGVPTPPNNTTTFLRGDGTFAAPTGGGTVTNTGGNLTLNAVVLGAGTVDTKVSTGITSNGTAQLILGVNATTIGTLKMFGNTSGDVTLQPTAAAGTATTQTLPATTGTLVNRVATANGVSASNSDGALTITLGAITPTTVNGNTFTTGTYTLTGASGKTLTFNNSLTLAGTDSTTMTFPAASTTVAGLGTTQTFTGINTFTPAARSSGVASYLTITMPSDTGQTAATESIGVNFTAGTRTWADGTTTLQREHFFGAPTYNKTTTAATFTTAVNVDVADPIAGTGVTITNNYSLRAANVLFTGIIKAGSSPTTLTDSDGKILSAALNTVAVAQGGTGTGSAGITAFNNITGYTASGATGTTSTNLVFSTSPTLTTPNIGAATATSVTVASNSQALVLGTSGDVTIYGNSLDVNNTETWIYGTKASHALLLRSPNTTFRILAYSSAGYGYFQAGVTGGSNNGSLYFSGYNGATATQVQFISTDSWATGNLGVGHSGTNSAKLHVISTTEQFRAGYSTTNYWNAVTDSGSVTTFTATGTSPTFRFATPIQFNDGSSGSSWLPWTDGNIYLSSANIIFRNAGGTEQGRLDSSGLNLRPKARVTSTTSSSTPTPNCDNEEIYILTALAVGATFGAVSGTPTNGQRLLIRIKDNGTARTLGWNSAYRAMGVALPTTTVISKTMYIGFIYNSTDSKWDCVSVAQEA